MGMDIIRQAVCKFHGGFDKASDAEVKTLWEALPAETKERYLQAVNAERSSSATRNKSRRAVQDNT
jgi:hypothetical protein